MSDDSKHVYERGPKTKDGTKFRQLLVERFVDALHQYRVIGDKNYERILQSRGESQRKKRDKRAARNQQQKQAESEKFLAGLDKASSQYVRDEIVYDNLISSLSTSDNVTTQFNLKTLIKMNME